MRCFSSVWLVCLTWCALTLATSQLKHSSLFTRSIDDFLQVSKHDLSSSQWTWCSIILSRCIGKRGSNPFGLHILFNLHEEHRGWTAGLWFVHVFYEGTLHTSEVFFGRLLFSCMIVNIFVIDDSPRRCVNSKAHSSLGFVPRPPCGFDHQKGVPWFLWLECSNTTILWIIITYCLYAPTS